MEGAGACASDEQSSALAQPQKYFCNHCPCGALCKWCKSIDTWDNPLTYLVHVSKVLMWRRQYGKECNICPYFIENTEVHRAIPKKTLLDQINGDHSEQVKFNQGRAEYIKNKNATDGKQSARRPVAAVSAFSSSSREYKKVCGNVWPVWLYKKVKGEGPPKRWVQKHEISPGQFVRGVLMDPSEGAPVGCYVMSDVHERGMKRDLAMIDPSDPDAAAQGDALYKEASKRIRTSVSTGKQAKGDDGELVGPMLYTAKDTKIVKAGEQSEDGDDACLAAVWGLPLTTPRKKKKKKDNGHGSSTCSADATAPSSASAQQQSSPKAEAAEVKSKPAVKRPKRGAASHPAAATTAAATAAPATAATAAPATTAVAPATTLATWGLPSPATSAPQPVPSQTRKKAQKEIEAAEQALQQVDEVKQSLSNLFLQHCPKHVEKVIGKVDSKLSGDTSRLVTDQHGEKVLDDLREGKVAMTVISELVACMWATSGAQSKAAPMRAALTAVRGKGITVASKADEMAFMRAAGEAVDGAQWDTFRRLLAGEDSSVSDFMSSLVDAARETLQVAAITKALSTLCMHANKSSEEEQTNVDAVRAFLSAASQLKKGATCYWNELEDVHQLVSLAQNEGAFDDSDLHTMKKNFTCLLTKGATFYKLFALLPTGIAAVAPLPKFFDQKLKDQAQLSVLKRIQEQVLVVKGVTADAFRLVPSSSPSGGQVLELPLREDAHLLTEALATVTSQVSRRFADSHVEELTAASSAIETYHAVATRAMCAVLSTRWAPVLDEIGDFSWMAGALISSNLCHPFESAFTPAHF